MIEDELKKEAEKFARTEMSHPNEYGMYYCTFLKVAEPREKQIADLEDKLANADYQLEGRDNEIRKLEKDNADLQHKVDTLQGFLDRDVEFDNLQKENAELKEINTHTLSQLNLDNGELIIENEKLKKENAKLSDNFKIAKDNEYEYQSLYIKAKDILRRLMASQPTPSSMYEEADLVGWREVNKEAEQFLKNDGCPNVMCEDCTKEDCKVRQLGLVEVKK